MRRLSLHLPAEFTLSNRTLKDFALFRKLIQLLLASYAVPVRRAGGSPPASLRFHLPKDTLAFGQQTRAASPAVDFHHQVNAHAGRTSSRRGRLAPVLSHHRTCGSASGGSPSLTKKRIAFRPLPCPPRGAAPLCAGEGLGPPAVPRGFTTSSRGQAPSGVFCCLRPSRELIGLTSVLMFGPSPRVHVPQGTMPSADSCRLSRASRHRLPALPGLSGRPPRVRALTFTPRPPHILRRPLAAWDFAVFRQLIRTA